MATDKQLIQQILLGRSEAFGDLFRKYQRQIYSICQKIVKNSHDAEELVQESFVHAYLKLEQLEDPDKFFPWLKKIAQNRSKNYLYRKKEKTIPLAQVSVPIIAPDKLLLKQELIDAIIESIESLPRKDREVIRAHIEGLSHSEIGERLGISTQASKDRLYRVRKKIKAYVKDLLNAIFGLPKMLPFKKIISGGVLAMKIGTNAKVTIGVISVLVAGFIGFQIVTHQPDVKSPKVATQQQTTRSKVKQRPVSKMDSRPSKSELEESFSRLDSLEGITPVEEVTEEASPQDEMQEQEELQDEVS